MRVQVEDLLAMAREQDARSVAASAAVASTAALKKRISGLQVRLHTKLD